jgi:hypothetical protein
MQYRTISLTDEGRSAIITVDDFQTPFNLGLAAKITAGTPTFSIQYSLDDPLAAGYSVATATWFSVTGLAAVSATSSAALTIPCRAICIYMATGQTGTVELKCVQAGPAA